MWKRKSLISPLYSISWLSPSTHYTQCALLHLTSSSSSPSLFSHLLFFLSQTGLGCIRTHDWDSKFLGPGDSQKSSGARSSGQRWDTCTHTYTTLSLSPHLPPSLLSPNVMIHYYLLSFDNCARAKWELCSSMRTLHAYPCQTVPFGLSLRFDSAFSPELCLFRTLYAKNSSIFSSLPFPSQHSFASSSSTLPYVTSHRDRNSCGVCDSPSHALLHTRWRAAEQIRISVQVRGCRVMYSLVLCK